MTATLPTDIHINELFKGVYWHQKWKAFDDFTTPGINDVESLCNEVGLPQDLSGKRVLDIGYWNGCFSFEAERRGALEVVGIGPECSHATGAQNLAKLLDSKNVRFELGTAYDLNPDVIGKFDYVFFFGVFYHLRYPLLALDKIFRICHEKLFIETEILQESEPNILEFYRNNELNDDYSNWFVPSSNCLIQMLSSSGFNPHHQEIRQGGTRMSIACDVEKNGPEWMKNGSSEGVYYDTITKPIFD